MTGLSPDHPQRASPEAVRPEPPYPQLRPSASTAMGSVSSITTNELVASVYHSPVEGESGLTLVGTWPGGSGVLAAIR